MKIKFKNVLALLLVVCMMATLFAACGDKKEPEVTPSASAPVSQAPSDSGDDDGDDEEIITINVWLPELGSTGSGAKWEIVEAAMNELTEKEIGIHVNYTWLPLSDVGTQFTLAMSNKEAIDVVGVTPIVACSFPTFFANGMVMDIAPYLEENAPDIIETMSEFNLLNAFTIEGGIYGIPTFRQLNTNLYLIARKDVLEQVGMLEKYENMQTWAEYEEIMEKIKNEAAMYPAGGGNYNMVGTGNYYGGTSLSEAYRWDTLGDTTNLVYTDQDGNVSLSYAEEDLIGTFKMLADWNKKGYIYPDTPFTKDLPEELCRQKSFAGYIVVSEYGVEANKSQTVGTDMICLEIAPGMLSTSATQGFAALVPVSSKNPEAAVRYLNFVHTSKEYMNMINWGVEGETYEMNEDGEAAYIDGADTSTSGYHYADFMFGNQFLASPWAGSGGADFRERAFDNFAAAPVSMYMGLTVDVSDVSTIMAALVAVKDEFAPQITCGMYTDEMHAEFLAKLESANIKEYLALYQSAVDEFLK